MAVNKLYTRQFSAHNKAVFLFVKITPWQNDLLEQRPFWKATFPKPVKELWLNKSQPVYN